MLSIADFPKYEAFKESGVDWLGGIPSGWNVKPGMVAFTESKRDNRGMKESRVLSLSYGRIIVKPDEKLVGLVPESFETYQLVDPGDIIVRCTDLQNDQTSLRTGLAKDKGIITSAYLNLKVNQGYDARYMHYYLHALDTSKVLYKFGTGLRQNLGYVDFKRLPVLDIPIEWQVDIAKFLERKTSQIDEAIAIKEQQIALLKERKQIIIQKAVTQGLDPNVPMKDSGVDWIGEIPERWDIVPNKKIFSLKKNLVGKKSAEYELLSLTLRGVIKRDMENPEGKFPADFDTYQEVRDGDFVFCLFDVEETPRAVGLSSHDGMITGAYTVFGADPGVSKEFLYLFYLSLDSRKMMRPLYKGLRNTIPKDAFLSFKTPLPSLSEQKKIVQFVEVAIKRTELGITHMSEQIEKLKEYKTTLINSAVTGKIKITPGMVED